MSPLPQLIVQKHGPRTQPQGTIPPLKVPAHTSAVNQNTRVPSNGYMAAPATEFRDSIGIAGGFAGPNYPNATKRAFWCAELQYLGIRHLRYTPITNDGNHLQMARDWSDTQIDTLGTGKLEVEAGWINNNWAVERGCTGVFDTNSFRTIDFCMNLFLNDAKIRKAISVFEMTNEPNLNTSVQCPNYTPPAGTPSADGSSHNCTGVCDRLWKDKRSLTWLQCLGEYCKKTYEKYVRDDPRCAGMGTVVPSCTDGSVNGSVIDGNIPNGQDIQTQWGDIRPYCFFGTYHPYCGFTLAGRTFTINLDARVPIASAGGWPGCVVGAGAFTERRMLITEFGYNVQDRPGVGDHWAQLPSFEVLGNYMLRSYLEAFIRGHERHYFFRLDAQGDALPRAGQGAVDEYIIYTWNGDTYGTGQPGTTVTNWSIRTECVEMMHRMTQTVGTGDSQPNVTWSICNAAGGTAQSDVRWLMLRRDLPTPAHVLFVWRWVNFLAQDGVPLGSHTASNAGGLCSVVTPSPETVHINLPNATTVTETHPIDGAADVDLTFSGSGAGSSTTVGRGVDVVLREKPFLLVIE